MRILFSILVVFLIVSVVSAEPYTEPVAIFVSPTAQEIEFAEKNKTEEEYSSWVDHGTYYSYMIEQEIEKQGVPIVYSKELEFEFSVNGKLHTYSLKKRKYQWSIIMFNGVDPPREFGFPFDPTMKPYYEKGAKK